MRTEGFVKARRKGVSSPPSEPSSEQRSAAPPTEKVFSFTVKGLVAGGAGLLVLFGVLGYVWRTTSSVLGAIATKSDVAAIASSVGPRLDKAEQRIYNLELLNAAHFGASPSGFQPGASGDVIADARFVLAQFSNMQQQTIPSEVRRRVVVPQELITSYRLSPSQGGTYALLGEDGRYYSLDDVLSVVIQMHLEEMRRLGRK